MSIERSGLKRGGCEWLVHSTEVEVCSVVMFNPLFGVGQEEPSPCQEGEGHGRHLGAGSGC